MFMLYGMGNFMFNRKNMLKYMYKEKEFTLKYIGH